MSLKEAIQNFAALRDKYETAKAEHENLTKVLIPEAEAHIKAMEMQRMTAEGNLSRAGTVSAVQESRAKLSRAEEALKDAQQLLSNLNRKTHDFPYRKGGMVTDLEHARLRMWELKRAELLEQLALPPAAIEALEMLVAADYGVKGDHRKYSIGDIVADKYGHMPYERILELNEALLTEMTQSVR